MHGADPAGGATILRSKCHEKEPDRGYGHDRIADENQRVVVMHDGLGLTRKSSAAASDSAIGYLLQYLIMGKGGNKPARRRLQRLVRPMILPRLCKLLQLSSSEC